MTPAARLLNQLLGYEINALVVQSTGPQMYVPPGSVHLLPKLRQVIRETREHPTMLADALDRQGEVTRPVTPTSRLAAEQYLHLDHLLPQLIAEQQAFLQLYDDARDQLADSPAVPTLTDLRTRHARHLQTLQELAVATQAGSST